MISDLKKTVIADRHESKPVPRGKAMAAPDTEFTGVIKRYSEKNGLGFITCAEVSEKYGKDPRIFRKDYESLKLEVGVPVKFRIRLDGGEGELKQCPAGQPYATNVERLADG